MDEITMTEVRVLTAVPASIVDAAVCIWTKMETWRSGDMSWLVREAMEDVFRD